jgi:hypothetical protein
MTDEEKKQRKVLLGAAILRPMDEKDHFGLFRPVIIRGWDEELGAVAQVELSRELGPLKVFRPARGNDRVDLRTIDPRTQREIMLHQVWDAREEQNAGLDLEFDPGRTP